MGIRNMTKKMVAEESTGETALGQETTENERDETARWDARGIEALQHADTMQDGEPEKCQQLQQQPKPKLQPKQQPKPQHELKPRPAPTLARQWETVPP